jgi:hypothetical protein
MGVMLDAPWNGVVFTPPTAIDIATIENAIVNRLRSQISSIEIAHYPDRPETWRLTHRVGAALVRYNGARYGELLDTAAIIQERKLEFEIAIMMRDLGWAVGGDPSGPSPGAYAIIEGVRTALTGYRIPGCRQMFPVREKFVKRDKQGGVWTYASTFALSTVAVEASRAEEFPLFVKGVALEEGGQTSITVGAAAYTFNSDLQVQLPQGNVFAVSITGPGGATLIQGTDFSVDRANGIVRAIAGGAISAGEMVQIAYTYAEEVIAATGQTEPAN